MTICQYEEERSEVRKATSNAGHDRCVLRVRAYLHVQVRVSVSTVLYQSGDFAGRPDYS